MKLTTMRDCPKCKGSGVVPDVDRIALRELRKSVGVSLRHMAKQIGITAPYLSDIELGRRGCPDYVVAAYNELTK